MNRTQFYFSVFMILSLAGCELNQNKPLSYSGTIEMTEYSIGLGTSGRIAGIFAEEGQRVTKGQLLAFSDHYAQAKKDVDRVEDLVPTGGISRQEYEHLIQEQNDNQIISPVDGIVLIRVRESGEAVTAGSPVLVIGELGKLWVKVYVPENLISQVKMNQKARIRIDGVAEEIQGFVSFISTSAEFTPRNVQTPEERAKQMFGVKVQIENPVNIHPGVSADVEILNE